MAQNWLHCNQCFYQPDKKGFKFYLTNCSHIFCEKCVSSCTKDKCKLCGSQCTTLPLAGKIPKQVEDMFTDPLDHLKKNLKSFSQIYEFHKSHQRRILRHLQNKIKHYDVQIGEAKKFLSQAKIMEKEFQKLKKENEYFKSLINKKDCSPRNRNKPLPQGLYGGGLNPKSSLAYSRSGPHGHSSHHQQYNNMSGYNIPTDRLIARSPPELGKSGSLYEFNLKSNLRKTPDSGFEDCDSPLTVARPIHFGSSQD